MRGRRPTTGLSDAIGIARARGEIMKFCDDPDRVSDFIIRSPGRLVFVRVMRVTRLRCTPEDLDEECQKTIRVIRTLPGYGPVVRELWVYSRHGWRYFRIGDTAIERIDKDGNSAAERQRIQQRSPASPAILPEPATQPATTPETSPVRYQGHEFDEICPEFPAKMTELPRIWYPGLYNVRKRPQIASIEGRIVPDPGPRCCWMGGAGKRPIRDPGRAEIPTGRTRLVGRHHRR